MLKKVLFWLLWPGLFVYFRFSRRVRVIITDGDHILLVKDRFLLWFGKDQWALPGGGLRRLETTKAAAARELQEELGIYSNWSQFTELDRMWIGSYGLQYRAHFLQFHLSHTTPLFLQPGEIAAAEWHDIRALDPKMLRPEVLTALELLAKQK